MIKQISYTPPQQQKNLYGLLQDFSKQMGAPTDQ